MGESERAVFELLELGPISAARSALYEGALGHLVAAKIARRTREGGYELAARTTGAPLARGEPATVPPSSGGMVTITASLPAACVEYLDRLGPNVQDAIIALLARYSGSGTRRIGS